MYWASVDCIGVTLLRAELRQLPDSCTPPVFFDPPYRGVLDKQPVLNTKKATESGPRTRTIGRRVVTSGKRSAIVVKMPKRD
jgi:hypothetical protein